MDSRRRFERTSTGGRSRCRCARVLFRKVEALFAILRYVMLYHALLGFLLSEEWDLMA